MPTTRDYYEILSIERTADGEEIKRAYRRMAMKFHPDRNPGDTAAEAKFKECAEAYEVLSDPSKKQRYDQFGHEGLRGAGAAGHDFSRMNVNDIFSMFNDIFGAGGGGGGSGFGGQRGSGGGGGGGIARGYDLETEVSITLEDVLGGAEREVEFTRLDLCEKCAGSGAKPGTTPIKCATCGGQGRVTQSGLGGMFRMVTACPACVGRGTVIKEFCPECRGKGRQPKKRRLAVRIPAGIADGQAVRVRGEGEPPPPEQSPKGEGVRGDLHVVVRVQSHEYYQRHGEALIMEMPISFTQAALGADVEVPTVGGGRHKLAIPRATQHGATFRIAAQGLPELRSGRRGEMVVVAKIEIPKKLSPAQEKLLRDFAATENHDVLPVSQGFWTKIKDAFNG
ncbi:MAG: molecular chaperone DnaJ [Phycisphaerales bacterium]|nr:molecular chaperone DnaJ [Phycisphaerales bacterium]